jgi:hypothetical protein
MSRKGANSYRERCWPEEIQVADQSATRIFITHRSPSLPTLDNGYEKMVKPHPMPFCS